MVVEGIVVVVVEGIVVVVVVEGIVVVVVEGTVVVVVVVVVVVAEVILKLAPFSSWAEYPSLSLAIISTKYTPADFPVESKILP